MEYLTSQNDIAEFIKMTKFDEKKKKIIIKLTTALLQTKQDIKRLKRN